MWMGKCAKAKCWLILIFNFSCLLCSFKGWILSEHFEVVLLQINSRGPELRGGIFKTTFHSTISGLGRWSGRKKRDGPNKGSKEGGKERKGPPRRTSTKKNGGGNRKELFIYFCWKRGGRPGLNLPRMTHAVAEDIPPISHVLCLLSQNSELNLYSSEIFTLHVEKWLLHKMAYAKLAQNLPRICSDCSLWGRNTHCWMSEGNGPSRHRTMKEQRKNGAFTLFALFVRETRLLGLFYLPAAIETFRVEPFRSKTLIKTFSSSDQCPCDQTWKTRIVI